MEISSQSASWSEEDTATAASSVHATPFPSDAHKSKVEEAAALEPTENNRLDKAKGKIKEQKRKHGVMSLPAEIREVYVFQSSERPNF